MTSFGLQLEYFPLIENVCVLHMLSEKKTLNKY